MIGRLMFIAVVGPIVVTVAFLWFCLVLVALAIGYIDPKSSPGAEWAHVMRITNGIIEWWRAPRF